MAASINIEDMNPEQRQILCLRKPRESKFSAEEVRGWALKCLAPLANLSRSERTRVLKHAMKINRV